MCKRPSHLVASDSNALSVSNHSKACQVVPSGSNRTPGLLSTKQVLCRLSYEGLGCWPRAHKAVLRLVALDTLIPPGANPFTLTNTAGDCLCVAILWLALSQPFGLKMTLGVPQQSPCVLGVKKPPTSEVRGLNPF